MGTPAQDLAYRWSPFGTVATIVDEKFEDGRSYALVAYNNAVARITELRDLASSLELIDTSTVFTDIDVPDPGSFTTAVPASPAIVLNLPGGITDVDDIEDALSAKLLSDIQSTSPAIPNTVETAIFERELERAVILHQDTLDNIADEWSKRGFTLPNAFLLAVLSQAEIDYTNKRLDISRDIAIKNFELTDANMKFAIQQGMAFVLNRIEVYKAQVSAEISRIDALVKTYLGQAQVYQAEAQVFTALSEIDFKIFDATLREQLAHAELVIKNTDIAIRNYEQINGLRIEAVRAIGSINAQMVAGSLSSVSASAHLSSSNSASYSSTAAEHFVYGVD